MDQGTVQQETVRQDTGTGQGSRAADRPIGELTGLLTEQVSGLIRQELRLAQREMAGKGKRLGRGAGLFGGSGVVALYGVAAALAAVILLLAKVMPAWGGALIVAGVLLAISALLAAGGRRQTRRAGAPIPEHAAGSIKTDVAEIKGRAHR